MLLMVEKHFRAAPFTWRQRAAFWAAFLYYMASAALLVTGPLPTLVMMWFFPRYVHAYNYLPMVPAILATLLVFPVMARGWRPSIYRVGVINSACHLLAIFHALRDRVEEWVPTGMSRTGAAGLAKREADVPTKVNRILLSWIILEQTALWTVIALRVRQDGPEPYWATIALAAIQFYFLAPLLTRGKGLRERRPPRNTQSPPGPATTDAKAMTLEMERIR
jgi:cellulose synthase (UDP-forming)